MKRDTKEPVLVATSLPDSLAFDIVAAATVEMPDPVSNVKLRTMLKRISS